MAAALPVALDRDDAVVGALVVVGGFERVAQLPHPRRRPYLIDAEADEADVRAARLPGEVGERHLDHRVAPGIEPDQDLLQYLEVRRSEFQAFERGAPVKAVAAGQIADRKRQQPA